MVAMTGLEPVTPALWVRCSNQLSYIALNCGRILKWYTPFVKHLFKNLRSEPISRVLSRTIIPLGVQSLIRSSDLPESSMGHASGFLFGLASGGVYHAMNCCQSCGALLPHPFTLTFYFSEKKHHWRRSTLCCTFRRLTPPRRYLAPCPMKPGLSSPALVTETSTAAIVWLTSERILTNFSVNCLRFFEQLDVYTFPSAALGFQHDSDQVGYSPQGRIKRTGVDHDAPHILYINQDVFRKSPHPYKLPHWGRQVHRHHN